jgi:hypothetical protein
MCWIAALVGGLVLLGGAGAGCGEDPGSVETASLDSGVDREPPHSNPPSRDHDSGTVLEPPPLVLPDASVPDGAVAMEEGCERLNCGLHGDCVMDANEAASCVCDHGYVADPGAPPEDGLCVEDRTCVTARILECRWSEGSSVGVHFSLQYCSGNPLTDLAAAQLVIEEEGNAGYQALLPSESSVTIVPHDIVSHVYLVIDISNSIQQSAVLDDVAAAAQNFIDSLERQGGRHQVSVLLFDGKPYLYEFQPDTSDLATVRERLDMLASTPGSDPASSNVYGAVIEGIHELERARNLRELVNNLGLLTTGTLIVISDGDDRSSTRSFDDVEETVNSTPSNIITVGLGDLANYPKLTEIGRDGSYSAPNPEAINQAFQQIAGRLRDQRDSTYLVGYCSPKRAGTFRTRIGIAGFDFERPVCAFNAARFTPGCSRDSFNRDIECADAECGDVIGCGECPEGACCASRTCVGPSRIPETGACGGEYMCEPEKTCADDKCTATVGANASCNNNMRCDLGAMYCGGPIPLPEPAPPKTCLAALPLGSVCESKDHCQSLHCGVDPDAPGSPNRYCLPPAEMFSVCGDDVTCEPGSYCDHDICKPQVNAGPCDSNAECKSGNCVMLGNGVKVCEWPDLVTAPSSPSCLFPLEL